MASVDDAATDGSRIRNHVVLCGRVSIAAGEHTLPSGDTLVTSRVVVDRELRRGKARRQPARKQVDAINLVAWTARAQRAVRRWQPGDEVYLEGMLRRRFFRTARGLADKMEVEVTAARMLSAGRRRADDGAPGG